MIALSSSIISGYKSLPLGNIADVDSSVCVMDYGIRPLDNSFSIVAQAFTVKGHPGDNLAIHKAIYEAPKNSVLVVDV